MNIQALEWGMEEASHEELDRTPKLPRRLHLGNVGEQEKRQSYIQNGERIAIKTSQMYREETARTGLNVYGWAILECILQIQVLI